MKISIIARVGIRPKVKLGGKLLWGVLQVWEPRGGWEERLSILLIPLGRFWELGQQHISDHAQSPHFLSLGP